LGAIKTWAANLAANERGFGVAATRESKCRKFLFATAGLGTEYIKCVQHPLEYLERMFGQQIQWYPKWYKEGFLKLDANTNSTTPLDAILWLLAQFIILTPITDPAVVAYRYALYQKQKIKMKPLEEVITLSAAGVGLMQCNCRNGMHYGIDPHCIGDLLEKGIILDFTNQDNQDPTAIAARGAATSNKGARVLKPGSSKIKQVVAPVFQRY
jgi:hypothetical protein